MQTARLRDAVRTQAAIARSIGAGLCGAIALGSVATAAAPSVQRCRVDGAVVFQDGPCRGGEAEPLPTPARPVSPEKPAAPSAGHRQTLGELLRQRDGDRATRDVPEAPGEDGSTLLRSRMGAV